LIKTYSKEMAYRECFTYDLDLNPYIIYIGIKAQKKKRERNIRIRES